MILYSVMDMVRLWIYGEQVSSVEVDSYQGAFQATEHLIKLGHTRISVISSPSGFKESRDRLRGYQEALKQYDLDDHPFLAGTLL